MFQALIWQVLYKNRDNKRYRREVKKWNTWVMIMWKRRLNSDKNVLEKERYLIQTKVLPVIFKTENWYLFSIINKFYCDQWVILWTLFVKQVWSQWLCSKICVSETCVHIVPCLNIQEWKHVTHGISVLNFWINTD